MNMQVVATWYRFLFREHYHKHDDGQDFPISIVVFAYLIAVTKQMVVIKYVAYSWLYTNICTVIEEREWHTHMHYCLHKWARLPVSCSINEVTQDRPSVHGWSMSLGTPYITL